MSTRAEAARLARIIDISEYVCGALAIILAVQLLVLIAQEYRLKRPLTKFMFLLCLMGALQLAQFIFFSIGGFFERWYIRIPRLVGVELKTTYLVLSTVYNTLSIPKWLSYVAYIYYRSVSLQQILEPVPKYRKLIAVIIIGLSMVWFVLLIELYALEYIVAELLLFPTEDGLMHYENMLQAISITRYSGGALLVSLDFYLQFRFARYLRSFSKSTRSKFRTYYIIAQHCLVSTWMSFIAFTMMFIRDKVTSSYEMVLFDVLQNSATFLLISCLIGMRFRIQLTTSMAKRKSVDSSST